MSSRLAVGLLMVVSYMFISVTHLKSGEHAKEPNRARPDPCFQSNKIRAKGLPCIAAKELLARPRPKRGARAPCFTFGAYPNWGFKGAWIIPAAFRLAL